MDSCTPSISTNPEEALCHICSKIFKTQSSLNRHIKKIHKIDEPTNNMNQNHIICSLCEQDINFNSHEKLRKHLQDLHQVSIELKTFEFSSKQEYETWKDMSQAEVNVEYFMSDDDPKYYNAWVKIMRQEPSRLLCTWHVVKNCLNIKGKSKLQDPTLKQQMKNELRQIIREPAEDKFNKLCDKYVSKLEEANEIKFVDYLKKRYLTNKRKQMWAYFYRRNFRINTNMAIESLNNLLKTNYLKRNAAVGIEKLLDTMDELVKAKMWTRIVDILRPSAGPDWLIKKAPTQILKKAPN
uniref:Uncharacterized protein LOC114346463 isoform X2 n=1 Tax=Diabrotica virgifera virgifera TaxID=50390 RepID=A0A6P7H5L1_DIAVI